MMAEYRVRRGMAFGAFNQYGPGDKVLLSPEEAAGFLDKLELVQPLPNPPPSTGSGSGEGTGDGSGGDGPWNKLEAKIVAVLTAASLTPEQVQAMSDDELLAVKGVGPATLLAIRGVFT